MRTLVVALLVAAFATAPAFAQKKPTDKPEFKPGVKDEPSAKDEPKLKIGDPAPPLTVSKWHQGPEVKAFEKDTVYVLVFWEARDASSEAVLKAANDTQAKVKGVVCVAVSSGQEKPKPGGPRLADETTYLKEVKTKYTFGFANAPTRETQKAYGGLSGPAAVVVGKDGKVAFTCGRGEAGLYLAAVAGKVADGTWKGQADADAIAAVRKEYREATAFPIRLNEMNKELQGLTPEKALDAIAKAATDSQKTLDEFLKKHPEYQTHPGTLGYQVELATRAGDQKGAEKAMEALLKPGLDLTTLDAAGRALNEVGRNAMFGGLKPEVAADKLFGMVIDAVLKSDLIADRNGEYLMGIVQMTALVGATDKGLELAKKLIDASAQIPADRKPEMLKQFQEQLRQAEKQIKEQKPKK